MFFNFSPDTLTLWYHQDFVPKLKEHLLPRIKDIIQKEASDRDADSVTNVAGLSALHSASNEPEHNKVFIKNDRIYRHNLARFNYTTYDVRRSQDVINPRTSHRDIMLLANNMDNANDSNHPFLYARVLGIYHANVIYAAGNDYTPRRMEFLWVRWFKYDQIRSVGWGDLKLDPLRFPPMAAEGAFGFVDPKDVLRGCHILPAFANKRARADGVGLSALAQDAKDWSRYYVNRCVNSKIT